MLHCSVRRCRLRASSSAQAVQAGAASVLPPTAVKPSARRHRVAAACMRRSARPASATKARRVCDARPLLPGACIGDRVCRCGDYCSSSSITSSSAPRRSTTFAARIFSRLRKRSLFASFSAARSSACAACSFACAAASSASLRRRSSSLRPRLWQVLVLAPQVLHELRYHRRKGALRRARARIRLHARVRGCVKRARSRASSCPSLGWLERPTRYILPAVRPRYNALCDGGAAL